MKNSFWDPPYPRTMLYLRGQRGVFSKVVLGSKTLDMTFEGLGEMFEGNFADMCAEIFSIIMMGGTYLFCFICLSLFIIFTICLYVCLYVSFSACQCQSVYFPCFSVLSYVCPCYLSWFVNYSVVSLCLSVIICVYLCFYVFLCVSLLFFAFLCDSLCFYAEGVVVGFQIFAWAPN